MTLSYALSRARTSFKFATVGVVAVALAACQLTGSANLNSQKRGSLRSGLGSDVGAREHPRVVATYGGVYGDSKAEIAVAKVVGGLVAASEAPDVHYRVTLLNSPAVNAFALPGGYLYVTRGLLALSNDTSELAAVLAHEMAHVSARHAIKRQRQAEEAEFVTKVMSNIGKDQQAIDATVKEKQLQFARFSQEQELEADDVGVRTLAGAGYDPYAAARFLNTMGQFARYQQLGGETSSAPDFLSSHPNTPDRIQRAVRSARQIGAPGIGLNGRADYLAVSMVCCSGMIRLKDMYEDVSSFIKGWVSPLVSQKGLCLKTLLRRFLPAMGQAQRCGLMVQI